MFFLNARRTGRTERLWAQVRLMRCSWIHDETRRGKRDDFRVKEKERERKMRTKKCV